MGFLQQPETGYFSGSPPLNIEKNRTEAVSIFRVVGSAEVFATMRSEKEATVSTIIETLKRSKTYVSSTETMRILGVTRQTLCRWVNTGKIIAVRIGKDNKSTLYISRLGWWTAK